MTSWIRTAIRALVAPEHRLRAAPALWHDTWRELRQRGGGWRESGAFFLGRRDGDRRVVEHVAYYDDLDPRALNTGIIRFDGAAYSALWQRCRETGLDVVGDVHTHPGSTRQSGLDRDHPMIARAGHLSLILPDFAQPDPDRGTMARVGLYEYLGDGRWADHTPRALYIGRWA